MELVKKLLPLLAILSLSAIAPAYAETPNVVGLTPVEFKLLTAMISFSVAAIAAAWAICRAGSASMAAAAERPELRTNAIIIAALGEAIGIYGIVMGILILGQAV